MNISEVSVKLTIEDLKTIIDEFVQVPGLTIDKIYIDNKIYIRGIYKKFINIPFKICASIVDIKRHKIEFKIEDVSIGIVRVFQWILSLALKKVLKVLESKGLKFEEGRVILDIVKILTLMPIKLGFDLYSLELHKDAVVLYIKNIKLNISEKVIKTENVVDAVLEKNDDDTKLTKAKMDKYGEFREDIENKVSEKNRGIIPYIMIMPDIIALFVRLFRDKRVPLKVKVICGSVLTYLLFPIDILPDFLPIIGKVDDFAIAFYALNKILCDVPENIIKENWQGKDNVIVIIREGVNYLYNVVGTDSISKVFWSILAAAYTKKYKRKHEIAKGTESDGKEDICG